MMGREAAPQHQHRVSEEEEEFEQLVQDYMHDAHYTSTKQAAFNVMYGIINAGSVLLPFAADCSGILLYCFGIILAASVSGYTSVMLVKMAHDKEVRRYEDLGELAFGKKGYYSIAFLQVIFPIITMIM